jgi:hypothetical protein
MSRDKGKRGEREFAEMLREHGFASARRGVQTACRGGLTAPDVICEELADTQRATVDGLPLDGPLPRPSAKDFPSGNGAKGGNEKGRITQKKTAPRLQPGRGE